MKKRIFSLILMLAVLLGTTVLTAIPASAVIPGYGIYVGGIQVNEENANDVLEDGTVSYDPTTNTLTLNNATITDFWTDELYGDESYYGIYSTVDGLTINLVGENKMAIKDPMENDTAAAIFSTKPLTVSGEGSIDIECWCGVMGMNGVLIKDCTMSFSTIGITAIKEVLVENATLSADYSLIMSESGDITVKKTIITDGGVGGTFMSELGTISIEDSSITVSKTLEEGCPIYTGDKLTVKNTTLDINASCAMAIMGRQLDFDGVTGSIEMNCEAGYAIMAGDIRMKNCQLDIEVVATKDSVGGIVAEDQGVSLENCSLKIDIRGGKDTAIGLGSMGGNIKATGCTLDIVAKNHGAFALYGSNVALTDCSLVANVTSIATDDSLGAGIFTENGSVKINGGVIDLTVSGPVLESPQISSGINMTNTLLQPELVGVDLKIKAPVVMTSAPYLTLYGRDYEITVSKDSYGDSPEEYNADNILTYKYFHIHGYYTVSFNANSGTGTMSATENLYGEFTLPENGFTAPEGKQFKGWAYAADGEIISETGFDVHKDTILYAIWEDISATAPDTTPYTTPDTTPDTTPEENDPNHTHSYSENWKQTADEHYKECACGAKQYKGAHIDSNANGSCDVCGYVITESNDGALGAGAIIGIVIGSVAVVGVGGFALFWFVIKKKSFADLIAIFKK